MKETDYKRLWKNEKKEKQELVELLRQASRRLEAQADVLRRVKQGLIKPEDIFKDE